MKGTIPPTEARNQCKHYYSKQIIVEIDVLSESSHRYGFFWLLPLPDSEDHAVVFGNSRLDEVVRPVLDEEFDEVVFVEANPHEMRQLEDEGEEFVFWRSKAS
ncbi:hypothetical protein HRED_08693 [Candidatus Haloredivivus sp. G17]|nr:hypothetical protein HRED_08693 [Candidatus Haloredivivus sp. G17]